MMINAKYESWKGHERSWKDILETSWKFIGNQLSGWVNHKPTISHDCKNRPMIDSSMILQFPFLNDSYSTVKSQVLSHVAKIPIDRTKTVGGPLCYNRHGRILPIDLLSHFTMYIWLVVSTPPKNMSSSVGMMKFPIYGKVIQMFQATNQILYLVTSSITLW